VVPHQAGGGNGESVIPETRLAKEEVRSRWMEFIAEVRRERISLGSVMESSEMIDMQGSVLKVGCGNDFQASSINRNKELLADVFQRIFHAKVRLEVDVTPSGVTPGRPGATSEHASSSPFPQDEHPVIRALMNELGAEPM
jgi:hypothetical protein